MFNLKLVQNWIPFAFCAFIVYQYAGSGYSANWQGFAIWLTMCFFYVGAVTFSLQKQIQTLEAEVKKFKEADTD